VTRLTTAKLGLVAGGLGAFGVGVHLDHAALRWTGLGLVAVAWLLRFMRS
jgi:hypothetical protein